MEISREQDHAIAQMIADMAKNRDLAACQQQTHDVIAASKKAVEKAKAIKPDSDSMESIRKASEDVNRMSTNVADTVANIKASIAGMKKASI